MTHLHLLLACLLTLSALAGESAPGAVPGPETDYRLFPGDLLRIDVFDHPDLSAAIRIPAQGTVSFPLIGDIPCPVGVRLLDFRNDLRVRLEQDYIVKAIITATVVEFGNRQVWVMGNVGKPGAVKLDPFQAITAMQAIGDAGGFRDDANRGGVLVIRDDPARPEAKIVLPVSVSTRAEDLTRDFPLQHGDLVLIPSLDRVYVIGQVNRSGAIDLPNQQTMTISKAVSMAGGFTRFARQSEVQLIRAGKPVMAVDVKALLSGSTSVQDPELGPGDTVFVPESRF